MVFLRRWKNGVSTDLTYHLWKLACIERVHPFVELEVVQVLSFELFIFDLLIFIFLILQIPRSSGYDGLLFLGDIFGVFFTNSVIKMQNW